MPLWRQLLGAATGAIVALLLYVGFAAASPNLSPLAAYLLGDFEEKIENIPAYPQSPRTVRDEAIARREALGDRARAATARLQKGEPYFGRSAASASSLSSSWSSIIPSSSAAQKRSAMPKEHDGIRTDATMQVRAADTKYVKGEKLPDTGIPLWAIGIVAFGIAMAVRYRKELLCSPFHRACPQEPLQRRGGG